MGKRVKNLFLSRFSDGRRAFYLISLAGILLYFLLSLRYGNQLYIWMIQENEPGNRFSDYFAHLGMVADPRHLYENVGWDAMGCFPPLAYCMYFLLYKLTAVPGFLPGNWNQTETIPGALPVMTYYLIFNALFFFLAIGMTGVKSRKRDLAVFSLLMLSAVFAGSGYLAANSTMLVLAFLVVAFHLKDSGKALEREASLVLFALCVALKLYPAVFGLLFLKEKRYREFFRLILYSVILLFGPFAFFGGFRGFRFWLSHITSTMQFTDFGRMQYLTGIFHTGLKLLFGIENKTICAILTVAVCLVWTGLAWVSRSRYRQVFFLICIMVFFPANAYRYSLAYFSIPLIMYLKEDRPAGPRRWPGRLAMALYGLLYTVPVWWLAVIPMSRRYQSYTLTSVEIYLYLVVYALIAVLMAAEITARRHRSSDRPAAG
uniref:DUF2029 domain-containing protein n=1 Tax=uncultured bacterium Contig12 TaxID=1393397 RepID=W0FIT8_9BACT|nr:hypothetical protein [uncultured bacterium Contig12]